MILKIASKELFYNWKVFLGTVIAILLSSIALATFSLLLINSIYYIVDAKQLHAINPTLPIAVFGSLVGISFFLGLMCIYSTLVLSIKLRWKFLVKLRIIGLTYRKIKLIIFWENLIISIICTTLSLFPGIGLASLIVNYLKSQNSLDSTFLIFNNFSYQWIYILATIVFVILIAFMAILPLKKINIKTDQDPYKKEKTLKVITKVTFGLISLAGALALTLIKAIEIGGMGQGMIILAIFLYIFFFGFCGKYLILILLQILLFFSNHTIHFKLILKSIKANAFKMILPISLLITTNLLMNYTTTITSFVTENNTSIAVTNILIIEVLILTFFISINALIQYILNQKDDFNKWKLLGMSKKQTYYNVIIQSLFISFLAIILSLPVNFFCNYFYTKFNNLGFILSNNWILTITLNVAIIIFCLIVSLTGLLINNKKPKLKK